MEMENSIQSEINQIEMKKPHVVILGAGASYAAFPNGDKYCKRIPLMNNLVEILELDDLLRDSHIKFKSDNFEDIYSKLYKSKEYNKKEFTNILNKCTLLIIPPFTIICFFR
jgi:hypothetical protein